MKYLFGFSYLLLVLISGVSNLQLGLSTQSFEFAMMMSLHFGAIVFYFIGRVSDGKVLVMLNAKYFCCFPMRYKDFVKASFADLLLFRLELLPLVLAPITLLFCKLQIGQAAVALLVLQLTTVYSLFVLLIIFHRMSTWKSRTDFTYIAVLAFIIPLWLVYKKVTYLGLALNPLGTFIGAPLIFDKYPYVMLIIAAQAVFLIAVSVLALRIVLRQWPTF